MQKFIICLAMSISCFAQAWAAEEEADPKSSAYVSLGEAMVLNLSSKRNRLTFLQINADVLITNTDSEEIITAHIPAIRHSLIVLLSEQKASDIKSPDKREEIRKQATAQVQELIANLSGTQDIADVLFSSILVQ